MGGRHGVVAGVFLLRILDPGGESLLAHHPHRDRHEGVILAAQLRALAVIDALVRGLEPGLVDAARDRVDLDAERRHGERMDHVRAGGEDAHDLVHRHDHLVVDRQEPRLVGLELLRLEHQRIELEFAVVRIAVAPIPLLAGRLHGQVGRRRVELEKQQLERRDRDEHQDRDRNQRPGHLNQGVMRGARGHRIGPGIEPNDHDDQQDEHEQRDRSDPIEQVVVEPDDVVHHWRDRLLQPDLPGRRLPDSGHGHPHARQEDEDRPCQCGQPLEHQHRRHCSFE